MVEPRSKMPTLKLNCFLRSGEEGYYPELTEFCEKCLTNLAPKSRALRKDKPAETASSFSAEEWEKIDSDLKVEQASISGKHANTVRPLHSPEILPFQLVTDRLFGVITSKGMVAS
jgi:hypothetical protein